MKIQHLKVQLIMIEQPIEHWQDKLDVLVDAANDCPCVSVNLWEDFRDEKTRCDLLDWLSDIADRDVLQNKLLLVMEILNDEALLWDRFNTSAIQLNEVEEMDGVVTPDDLTSQMMREFRILVSNIDDAEPKNNEEKACIERIKKNRRKLAKLQF